ncbi:hypothetical protein V8V91_10105 [Algoriphagus halophilus]|uniref:N-acyl-D-amino-acid deacylase family protein n=1 Tax=Algoriphagus halophilus TaxID=226505 RepID=UPI00358E1C43
MKTIFLFCCTILILGSCSNPQTFDVLIKNGQIVDGSGSSSYIGDVGINADTIAALGDLQGAKGTLEIDATGLVVAPGFINMLSWAVESLIEDGRSISDIKQGVTLEVFGEGNSMGPWNEEMKNEELKMQSDIKFPINWTNLSEYLDYLVEKGISTNVASFIGATTVRIHELGYEDRAPTLEELEAMKKLVRQAMEEGALGVGSSLIYAPAFYASTEELIELCKVAAEYDGLYISHMRSEGGRLLESLDELIRIADEADIRAEVYHLKMSGRDNWNKFDAVVAKIDSARAAGLEITTDMYNYVAGATGLDASMPPGFRKEAMKNGRNVFKTLPFEPAY